ncbi:MAG: hypothetical protein FD175_643 [Beijerinckiaceae bacterium]|nr:MAG: hypothetical protein FD175_643 [Beijerinckiaceae bacterium]
MDVKIFEKITSPPCFVINYLREANSAALNSFVKKVLTGSGEARNR